MNPTLNRNPARSPTYVSAFIQRTTDRRAKNILPYCTSMKENSNDFCYYEVTMNWYWYWYWYWYAHVLNGDCIVLGVVDIIKSSIPNV